MSPGCVLAEVMMILLSFSAPQLLMWNNAHHTTTADLYNPVLCLERPLHQTQYHLTCGSVNGTYFDCSTVEDSVTFLYPTSESHWQLPLDWTAYHTAAVTVALLLVLLSLLHRHLTSDLSSTSDDLCTPPSDSVVSLTDRLEGLTLSTAHHSIGGGLSWLRRAEQMKLLSATPATTQSCLVPSSAVTSVSPKSSYLPAQPPVVWPARLQQPRACLMSATASLSLTDQSFIK